MCSRVTCNECNKPSYAGCGAHVEQVLGSVPRDERCKCRETKREARTASHSDKPSSLLNRIFGR